MTTMTIDEKTRAAATAMIMRAKKRAGLLVLGQQVLRSPAGLLGH